MKCPRCVLGDHGQKKRAMKYETREEQEARWAAARALMPPPETRAEMIARWEANGMLVKDCLSCKEIYDSERMPIDVFMPHHLALSSCESGKHPHCTCSRCF